MLEKLSEIKERKRKMKKEDMDKIKRKLDLSEVDVSYCYDF